MIENLREFNKEAQGIRDALQTIQDFPSDIKEMMMSKLKNEILSETSVTVKEPVSKQNIFDEISDTQDSVDETTPDLTRNQQLVLSILPEFTEEEANASTNHELQDFTINNISKKVGLTYAEVASALSQKKSKHKGLMERGLINRVSIRSENNRPAHSYYKLKGVSLKNTMTEVIPTTSAQEPVFDNSLNLTKNQWKILQVLPEFSEEEIRTLNQTTLSRLKNSTQRSISKKCGLGKSGVRFATIKSPSGKPSLMEKGLVDRLDIHFGRGRPKYGYYKIKEVSNTANDIPETTSSTIKLGDFQEELMDSLPRISNRMAKHYEQELQDPNSPVHNIGLIKQLKKSSKQGLAKKLNASVAHISNTIYGNYPELEFSLVDEGIVNHITYAPPHKRGFHLYYHVVGDESKSYDETTHVWSVNQKPVNTDYPWLVYLNGKVYTHHKTQEEQLYALKMAEKSNGDRARMYNLPNCVLSDGEGTYSVFIPKTNELLFEKINLNQVRNFLDWLDEAKEYDSGCRVVFNEYFSVESIVTSKGMPTWRFRYAVDGKIKYIRASTIRELEVKMLKKGQRLARLSGECVVDLSNLR